MFFPDVVKELFTAADDSMAILRGEIEDVRLGPIIDDREYIDFRFRGAEYRRPLNPGDDWVVFGDGRESDKSIALRLLLRGKGK